MKEAERQAAKASKNNEKVRLLEKRLEETEKQRGILTREVEKKNELIEDLKGEADVSALEKEKIFLDYEQIRREYAATKEAFVHHKELMKYKSSMETQKTHELRKQQALAHSLTHSITQKQIDELNERIAQLEAEKTNMAEAFNLLMETHGTHVTLERVMNMTNETDNDAERLDDESIASGSQEENNIDNMDKEEMLAASNREIVPSQSEDAHTDIDDRICAFSGDNESFLTPERVGEGNTTISQALVVRSSRAKKKRMGRSNQQLQAENDCTVLCSPS